MQNLCRPTDIHSEEQCHQDKQAAVISTSGPRLRHSSKIMFRQYVLS